MRPCYRRVLLPRLCAGWAAPRRHEGQACVQAGSCWPCNGRCPSVGLKVRGSCVHALSSQRPAHPGLQCNRQLAHQQQVKSHRPAGGRRCLFTCLLLQLRPLGLLCSPVKCNKGMPSEAGRCCRQGWPCRTTHGLPEHAGPLHLHCHLAPTQLRPQGGPVHLHKNMGSRHTSWLSQSRDNNAWRHMARDGVQFTRAFHSETPHKGSHLAQGRSSHRFVRQGSEQVLHPAAKRLLHHCARHLTGEGRHAVLRAHGRCMGTLDHAAVAAAKKQGEAQPHASAWCCLCLPCWLPN